MFASKLQKKQKSASFPIEPLVGTRTTLTPERAVRNSETESNQKQVFPFGIRYPNKLSELKRSIMWWGLDSSCYLVPLIEDNQISNDMN